MTERIQQVRDRLAHAASRAGRDPTSVTLIGATKHVDAARVRDAFAAGLLDFGESRVQEALDKIASVGPGPRWHFIGHVQRNKVRFVAGEFEVVHSIDSLRLAQAIDRAARLAGRRLRVLVEVNVAGEPTKHGVGLDAAGPLLEGMRSLQHLEPVGLMTIAPLVGDPEDARGIFRRLRQLRDRLRDREGGERLAELSMGMSGDFEVAVEEGATMVRIGRAVFGERQQATGEARSTREGGESGR